MPMPNWRTLLGRGGGADRRRATAMNRVEAAFWIVLARGPSATELHDRRRGIDGDAPFEQLLHALTGSTEFRLVHEGYARGTSTGRQASEVEAALEALGPPSAFIDLAYQYLLGR